MAKKENQKKVFNFDDSPLVKTTEQTVVEGYQKLENGGQANQEQGGGEPSPIVTEAPQPEEQTHPQTIPATVVVAQGEPTQNINVPIPISLHQRLKIISAQTRQNMKDLVALAIKEYVDRQG